VQLAPCSSGETAHLLQRHLQYSCHRGVLRGSRADKIFKFEMTCVCEKGGKGGGEFEWGTGTNKLLFNSKGRGGHCNWKCCRFAMLTNKHTNKRTILANLLRLCSCSITPYADTFLSNAVQRLARVNRDWHMSTETGTCQQQQGTVSSVTTCLNCWVSIFGVSTFRDNTF
jgi:hypothetical protein